MILTVVIVICMSACNGSDDDTVLTTKKRKSTTEAQQDGSIDIWSYLESEGADDPLSEEPGTLPSGGLPVGGYTSPSGNYTYEDTPVSFGNTDIFSSATTSKAGYPTFKWNPVSGAIRYNIYRSTSKNGTYSYIDSTTATSYTDKTAISGKKYFYQVKAVKQVPVTTKKNTNTTKPTTAPETTVPRTTRSSANIPQTAPLPFRSYRDAVNLFNNAANKVKTSATSATLMYTNVVYIEDEKNSDTLKTLLALAGVKEGKLNQSKSYVGHDKIIKEFPIEESEVSSTLTVDCVKNVSGNYDPKTGYYTLNIVLKNDPAGTTQYSGTCTDVVDISEHYSGATSETRGTTIQAMIYYDGTLDYVKYYVPTWIFAKYSGNDGNINMQMAFSVEELWSVNY